MLKPPLHLGVNTPVSKRPPPNDPALRLTLTLGAHTIANAPFAEESYSAVNFRDANVAVMSASEVYLRTR